MKENKRKHILNCQWDLLKRIKWKHKYPNIILFGDWNTNKNWSIEYIENITKLHTPKWNKEITTRSQGILTANLSCTLNYLLTNTQDEGLHKIENTLSDHYSIRWEFKIKERISNRKSYVIQSSRSIIKSINNLINSKWPNQNLSKEDLVTSKRTIRPIIRILCEANSIIKMNQKWDEKLIRLKDITKSDFLEYVKTLDLNIHEGKKSFYKILNSVIRYKNNGKIVRGVKIGDDIFFS